MPTSQTQAQPASHLREQILSLGEAFFAEQEAGKRFIPGQTYIPCSGKVLDASDLRALMERDPRIAERVHEMARGRLKRELLTPKGDLVTEEIEEEPPHTAR